MAQQAVERVGPSKHNLARTGRMALYGGGTSPPLPPFSPHPPPSKLTTGPKPNSRLRPRRHDLVLLPRAPDQFPHGAEPDHRRARADGPDGVRVDEPVLLPVVDGRDGGDGPGREAAGDVLGGVEEELDGVAGGAGGELPVRAAGAPRLGGECG